MFEKAKRVRKREYQEAEKSVFQAEDEEKKILKEKNQAAAGRLMKGKENNRKARN